MRKSGAGQDISGMLTVDGKVDFQSGLIAERFGGGNVSDIISKYQYDSSEDVHILKTNFVFLGVLNIQDMVNICITAQYWELSHVRSQVEKLVVTSQHGDENVPSQ